MIQIQEFYLLSQQQEDKVNKILKELQKDEGSTIKDIKYFTVYDSDDNCYHSSVLVIYDDNGKN